MLKISKVLTAVILLGVSCIAQNQTQTVWSDAFTGSDGSAASSNWATPAIVGTLSSGSTNAIGGNRYRFHGGSSSGTSKAVLATSNWMPLQDVMVFQADIDPSSWPDTDGAVLFAMWVYGENSLPDGNGLPTKSFIDFYMYSQSGGMSVTSELTSSTGAYSSSAFTPTISRASATWQIVLANAGKTMSVTQNGATLLSRWNVSSANFGTKVKVVLEAIYATSTISDTYIDNFSFKIPAVPITKYSSNPILVPSVTADLGAVRDATFIKTGSTYNIIYTGITSGSYSTMMLATASSPTGPYTKQGVIVSVLSGGAQADSRVNTVGSGDPFVLWDGSLWHMWMSVEPVDIATYGMRTVGHLTASGSSTAIPTSGWTWDTPYAIVGSASGWTAATTSGHTGGISAAKVYPAVGGGYIAFVSNWGSAGDTYHAPAYMAGYATAPALNGPWTLSASQLIGSVGGYQGEQVPFYSYYGGKNYLFCNRLGLAGSAVITSPTGLYIDVWSANAPTGPYTLFQSDVTQKDLLPGSANWETNSGDQGVVGFINDNGVFRAIYDANNSTIGWSMNRSIGGFTFTLPAPVIGSGMMMASD